MAEKQLARAKQLIQSKQYEEARALLITIDHPTADKWLAKLNSIMATKPAFASAGLGATRYESVQMTDYTSRAIILVVLYFALFIPGIIAGHMWSSEAKQDIEEGRPQRGARRLIRIHRWVMFALVTVLVASVSLAIGAAIALR